MTANKLNTLSISKTATSNDEDGEYNIPLDISDIILICREYNKLGWQIQNQVENILEAGVEDSIKNGIVKKESLPLIKNFLKRISDNVYFGDAIDQAQECIFLIDMYLEKNITTSTLN